jgi:hypothetical protein
MRHPHELAFKAIREVPIRKVGEPLHPDYIIRLRAHVANSPTNDPKTVDQHSLVLHAAEAIAFAERVSDAMPEHLKRTDTDVSDSGAARQDKNAYQKSYMVEWRKRKASERAAAKAEAAQ